MYPSQKKYLDSNTDTKFMLLDMTVYAELSLHYKLF